MYTTYQYRCNDASRGFSSHCDSLWITAEGLDVFLHPSQCCQLVQETPVAPSVFVSSALKQETHFIEKKSVHRGNVDRNATSNTISPQEAQDAEAILNNNHHDVFIRSQWSAVILRSRTYRQASSVDPQHHLDQGRQAHLHRGPYRHHAAS